MAFGDWIRGAFAQVNPFDGGKNFETYNPRRKREDEETRSLGSSSRAPQTLTVRQAQPQQTQLQVKRPDNMFADLNQSLKLPGSAPNNKATLPVVNQPSKPQVLQPPKPKAIPGYNILSPRAQKDALAKNSPQAQAKKKDEDRAKFWGNVPVIGTSLNWGAKLAAATGKMTGNKALEERANNQGRLLTLGMNNEEFNQFDQDTRNKLSTLEAGVTGLGALDIFGVSSLGKAPIIAGAKAGIKEGVTSTAGRQIIKDSLKQTGQQYGKHVVGGMAVAGAVDPAIQAYIKDGEVDWSSVPSSMLQGGLWAGAIPEFAGKARLVQKMNAGASLTPDESMMINTAIREAQQPTKIQVQQPRSIEVSDMSGEMADIPIANNNTQPRPIVEVSGDTPGVNQVKVPTPEERITERFENQPTVRPSRAMEGFAPTRIEDTALYTKAEVDAERIGLDEALANKEINKTQYKLANKELDSLPISDGEKGQKIEVQEVKNIPVVDETVVPTGLPETPGAVRAIEATAPTNAKSAEIAAQQPVQLPAEVQNILDNPKQFNKRQVASARNQRKLTRQMAKTKEQTAEAMDRIDTASPAAQSGEGFVPTGEFGKSANGGAYQKVNRQAEMQQAVSETANLSPGDVIKSARATAEQNGGGFNRRDIRNIAALFETKRLPRGSAEWKEARQILKEDGTNWGQQGALRNYTMRRTASADELTSRFESKLYRLADDPSKIDGKLFDEVEAAETKFADTRDFALRAYNQFTENPNSANAKAYHAAQDAAEEADKAAKMVEYKVAKSALKGNTDIKQQRELEKMAQSADMYQMDAVDASMLSGTGTFARNFVNSTVGGLEEAALGGVASRMASLTPNARKNDVKVGGGIGRDTVKGFVEGVGNIVDASKARAGAAGKNVLEHGKNWATTGNQLGDAVIDSQIKHNVTDHYTQTLKSQGFKGRELRDRASVMARQDPDNVAADYTQAARVSATLGSGITRGNKIESAMAHKVSDIISAGKPNKFTEATGKLVTRMTLGFPTAIGRSLAEGSKRFLVGAPTFIKALRTDDPQARAILVKEGIKQAGSGALVIPSLFYGLGVSGMITGAYPKDDEAEKERWKREGITENSIKIGGNYYQLPAYLGSAAIPGLFYASLGRNGGDVGAAMEDVAKTIPALLPTDQMSNILDVINGRADLGKFMVQTGASAVRAATPVGALLGQIAKSIDPTQNETNDGTGWENFVDKVYNGIPGMNLGLDAKTDADGNELKNPNPLALAVGASSAEQTAGVERTGVLNDQTNATVEKMDKYGAFSDPNIKAVITDEKTKKIYNDILAGKQVNPDDVKKVQEAMVKGVSSVGDDTAYLEREQYDTNLAVLNVKRELMASDPTTKPSDLEKMDVSIKRGEIYRDSEVPYDIINEYQEVGVDEWRNMGDPEDENYNPEMYQMLWSLDEKMAGSGVSYKKGALDKQKYSAKKAGKGRGGGGGGGGRNAFSAEFGTLKAGTGAPSVQQYETIDQRSGGVPVIQKQRPNIVHKIGFSG
jgi:hypothetical protein